MKNKQIIPLDDRVVIDVDPAVEKSEGGIILPEVGQERLPYGKVVVTGQGRYDPVSGKLVPLQVKAGDRVYYERNQGVVMELDGKKVMCVREHSIVAVIR